MPGRSGSRKRLAPSALGALGADSVTAPDNAALKPHTQTPGGLTPCDAAGDSRRGGPHSSRPEPGQAGGVSGGATAPGSRTGGAPGSARDGASGGAAGPGNGSSRDGSGGAAAQGREAQQEPEDEDCGVEDGRPQQRLRAYCGASTLAAGPAPLEPAAGAGTEAGPAWAAKDSGGAALPAATFADKRSGSEQGLGATSSGPLKALLLQLFSEQRHELDQQQGDEQEQAQGDQGHKPSAVHLGHPHKQSHAHERAQPHPPHQPHQPAHHYRQQQPQPCAAQAAAAGLEGGAWDPDALAAAAALHALLAPPALHGHPQQHPQQHQELQQREHAGEGLGWLLNNSAPRHEAQPGEVPVLAPDVGAVQLQQQAEELDLHAHAHPHAHLFAPHPYLVLQRPAVTATATAAPTATATTAASMYGGLYSSGRAHISSGGTAPYSELLSGPGFSYGATEAGEFVQADDAILLDSDNEAEEAAGEGVGSVGVGPAASGEGAAADGSGGAGSGAGGRRHGGYMIDEMLDAEAVVAEARGPQAREVGAQAIESAPVEGVGSVPASGPGDAHIWSAGTAGSGSGGRAEDAGGAGMAAFLAASGMPQPAKAGGARPVQRMPSWLPPAAFETPQEQGEGEEQEQEPPEGPQVPPAPGHVEATATATQHGARVPATAPFHAGTAAAAHGGTCRGHTLQPMPKEEGGNEEGAAGAVRLLRTGSSDTVLVDPDAAQPAARHGAAAAANASGGTRSSGGGSDDDISEYTDTGDLSTEAPNRLHSYVMESVGSAPGGGADAAARVVSALLGPAGVAAAHQQHQQPQQQPQQQQQRAEPVVSGDGGTRYVAETDPAAAVAAGAATMASGQGECFVTDNDARKCGAMAPQGAAAVDDAAEAEATEAGNDGAGPMAIGSGPGGSYAALVMQQRQQQLQQHQQQVLLREPRLSMEVEMAEPPPAVELQAQMPSGCHAAAMGHGLGSTAGAAMAMAAAVEAAAAAATARAAAAAASEAAAAAAAAAVAQGAMGHSALLAGLGLQLPAAGAFGLDAYPAAAVGLGAGDAGGVMGLAPLQAPAGPGAVEMAAGFAAAAGAEPLDSSGVPLLPRIRSDARSPVAVQQPSAAAGGVLAAAAAPAGPGLQSGLTYADAPPPQLLAPDVYMGFVGQLIASVHSATRAAATAAFRHSGPGLGGSNAAIVAAAAAAAQAAYRHGHPTVAGATACYGNTAGAHGGAGAAPHYLQQHQHQAAMPLQQQQQQPQLDTYGLGMDWAALAGLAQVGGLGAALGGPGGVGSGAGGGGGGGGDGSLLGLQQQQQQPILVPQPPPQLAQLLPFAYFAPQFQSPLPPMQLPPWTPFSVGVCNAAGAAGAFEGMGGGLQQEIHAERAAGMAGIATMDARAGPHPATLQVQGQAYAKSLGEAATGPAAAAAAVAATGDTAVAVGNPAAGFAGSWPPFQAAAAGAGGMMSGSGFAFPQQPHITYQPPHPWRAPGM